MTEPSSYYGWTLPIQASTFAKQVDAGIYIIHAAMIAIFVLWAIFFTYLLVRYRRRAGVPAKHGDDRGHLWSLAPDAAVLLFEIGLIVLYAVPQWSRMKMRPPSEDAANRIHVVAEQFNWNVHYPGKDGVFGRRRGDLVDLSNPMGLDPEDPAAKDDLVTVNRLHLPLGRPTIVELSSKDVIHSFSIPEFRVKQDAVPGMRVPVWFEPTLAGQFELTCAQLCGVGHAIMRASVVVHEQKDYAKWAAKAKKALPQG